MSFWKEGQKQKLAKATGIPFPHLSEILHRRRGVSGKRAKMLELVSGKILGHPIPLLDWLFNKETTHPAFSKKGT